jgi:hypothetical protein
VPYAAGTNTTSVAVGDFNGDGKPDLAASNYNSSNVSVLLNNGSNGDGKADVVFQDALGYVRLWLMNGTTIASDPFVGFAASSEVAAVRDYDGDGKADVLLRNLSGVISMWLMNGATIVSQGTVGSPGATYTPY